MTVDKLVGGGVKVQEIAARPYVEQILHDDKLIAIIIPASYEPTATEFPTSADINMQVGLIKYPAGGLIQPHKHHPLKRHIVGTCEVLFVRSGKAELSLYNSQQQLVAHRIVSRGDLILLVTGGHGFRMLEDTVLMEVKQGPYTGLDEKERFES